MSKNLTQEEKKNSLFDNKLLPFTDKSNSSLSRIDSFESEKDFQHTFKKNDKKSLFYKYGPIDGNIIYTYGIDAKIEKKDLKRDRRFTIIDEQQPLLEPQEIQRRKSAEGKLFGFLNDKIIQFGQLAPHCPNYKPPLLIKRISSPIREISPLRKAKESRKQRSNVKEIDQSQQDNKLKQRYSQLGRQSLVNTSSNSNIVDENKNQDKQQEFRKSSIIIPIQLIDNTHAVEQQLLLQKQQELQLGINLAQLNNTSEQIPSKTLLSSKENFNSQNNQKSKESIHNIDSILQKQNKIKIDYLRPLNKDKFTPKNSKAQIKIRNRNNTQTDFTENQGLQNQSLNNLTMKAATTTHKAKQNENLNSPKEDSAQNFQNQLFFNIHKKNTSSQVIQKYLSTTQANNSSGSSGFYQINGQQNNLHSDGMLMKNDQKMHIKKSSNIKNSLRTEKLAPIQLHETLKNKSKTSQKLFSQIYIQNNPLYKKIASQGKKVTLPDIQSNKGVNINNHASFNMQNVESTEDITREPLSQKSIDYVNQKNILIKTNVEASQKDNESKVQQRVQLENREQKVLKRKLSLKQNKKSYQENKYQQNSFTTQRKVSEQNIK